MKSSEVVERAFAMPLTSPAYPPGPYQFIDREYFIVTYRSDADILEALVPEPLQLTEPLVKFEFMRMPDTTGFGNYCESGQLIPVTYRGERGNYQQAMYLNVHAPIAGGRELWGFPKVLGGPDLKVLGDTLVGTLDYTGIRIATGTMGYKHQAMDKEEVLRSIELPTFLLKIIPHVDGSPRICELVRAPLAGVTIKGAWSGPAGLQLADHALASVAKLPVREVLSAIHIMTDLTLPLGTVMHDYLA
jgi:acetoacetate decarboxylase